MNSNKKNKSIECTVDQCANHSKNDNYCALEKIEIGTKVDHPTDIKCTNCNSFVPDDCVQ